MTWFSYGNISQESSIQIVEEARSIFNFNKPRVEDLADNRCVKLSPWVERLDFKMKDPANDNSALYTYF